MKIRLMIVLLLVALLVGGCGKENTQLDNVGDVNQGTAGLTEEMAAMLEKMGISQEEFAAFSPEKQQAILDELGVVAGNQAQNTKPSAKEYTTADVAAGGKYMVYIGDSMHWNGYTMYYEDGKLVKVAASFRKNSEEEPEEYLFEGDTLKDFWYIDKSLDELIRFFDEKDYGYTTKIEAMK